MKKIAVIPIYNEERTLVLVLDKVRRHTDRMVLIDDGSTDSTPRLLEEWAAGKKGVYILRMPRNTGMAGALKRGYCFVDYLSRCGEAAGKDVVINIDADNQHRPEYIPEAVRHMEKGGHDIVLTRRDFALYPLYKKAGNRLLSSLATLLSGTRYDDVESGMRFLRVKTVGPILDFFMGWRYSCAQEIALISAKLGMKVDNSFKVEINYYRPGTTFTDGFIVVVMSFLVWLRLLLRWKVRREVHDEEFKRVMKGKR